MVCISSLVRSTLLLSAALLLAACDHPSAPVALLEASHDVVHAAGISVALAPATKTLAPGETVQLIVDATYPGGGKLSPNPRQLTWSSSDPTIATVSASGMVTAVAAGTARITGALSGSPGTAVITVSPAVKCTAGAPNVHAPVSTLATLNGVEDTPVFFQFTATDDDLPCDSFTILIRRDPQGGFLYHAAADGSLVGPAIPPGTVLNPNDRFAYVPIANLNGLPIGSFDFEVIDAAGNSSGITTVDINIAPVNDPPVATSFTHTGFNYIPVTDVVLQAQDVENGANLTICIVDLPRNGDLYWTSPIPENLVRKGDCGHTSTLAYVARSTFIGCTDVPASAFPMTDTFTWNAWDGELRSATVTDPISIIYANDPPVFAGPSEVVGKEDTPVTFALSARDADGDLSRFIITALPSHGTLSVLGQPIASVPFLVSAVAGPIPQLTYMPNADFNTSLQAESFALRVRDGTTRDCDYTVKLTVNAVNDAPVITASSSLSATRSPDGTVSPALTSDIRVTDDARPGDLLRVTLRAQGAAAGRVDLVDPAPIVVKRLSATEVVFEGTLSDINAALGRGVLWTPNAGTADSGELVVSVDDEGSYGNPNTGSLVSTKTIPVFVGTDVTLQRATLLRRPGRP